MVNAISRLFDFMTAPKWEPTVLSTVEQRGYAVGSVAVDDYERTLGHDQSTFQPDVYANYLATSNAVYAVSRLRANLLVDLPLKFYKVAKNGDKVEVTSGDLVDVTTRVNPYWTRARLLEMIELSLCLWGASYVFVERGTTGRGTPRELWWARPDRVKVIPDPVNYIAGFVYEHQGREIAFRPSETVWIRYANPIDEYSGLSPLAAARLSADVATAAMKSNRGIFTNGMQAAGFVAPRDNTIPISREAAAELTELMKRRFSGVDNAHRWIVLAQALQFQSLGFSPKDAEFLGAIKQSLEDVARAYGVPIDLVGGQRTYENVAASERIVWAHTIRPEARLIAAELTEQLLPMFPGQADIAEFDFSDVAALHESEDAKWTREQGQLAAWVMTINEWRIERGLEPVDWGDVPWGPLSVAPLSQTYGTVDAPALPAPVVTEVPMDEDDTDRGLRAIARAVGVTPPRPAAGVSRTNQARILARGVRRRAPWERKIAGAFLDLLRRQRASAMSSAAPFELPRWIRLYRETMRPLIAEAMADLGEWAADERDTAAFDATEARVMQAVYTHVDLLARTWNQALGAGLRTGNVDHTIQAARDAVPDAARSIVAMLATSAVLEASRQANVAPWGWVLASLSDPDDEDVVITPEDLDDALKWWDRVMPEKYRGLLDAKLVTDDEGD